MKNARSVLRFQLSVWQFALLPPTLFPLPLLPLISLDFLYSYRAHTPRTLRWYLHPVHNNMTAACTYYIYLLMISDSAHEQKAHDLATCSGQGQWAWL